MELPTPTQANLDWQALDCIDVDALADQFCGAGSGGVAVGGLVLELGEELLERLLGHGDAYPTRSSYSGAQRLC